MSGKSREWPLVAFTLLAQGAIGAIVASAASWPLLSSALGAAVAVNVLRPTWEACFVAMVVAMAVSTAHLARPHRAVLALRNLGRSWVSAEVALAGMFVACLGGLSLPAISNTAVGAWLVASAVVGVAFLAAMARLYDLPARRAWSGPATWFSFLSATVLVGSAGFVLVLTRFGYDAAGDSSRFPDRVIALDRLLGVLVFALAAGAALELAAGWMAARRRREEQGVAFPLSPRERRRLRRFDEARAACASVVLLGAVVFVTRTPRWSGVEPEARWLLDSLALLAGAACVIGRVLFYEEGERRIAGV